MTVFWQQNDIKLKTYEEKWSSLERFRQKNRQIEPVFRKVTTDWGSISPRILRLCSDWLVRQPLPHFFSKSWLKKSRAGVPGNSIRSCLNSRFENFYFILVDKYINKGMVAWNFFVVSSGKITIIEQRGWPSASTNFLHGESITGNETASHTGRPRSTNRIFAVMRRLESKNVFLIGQIF